MLSLAAPKVSGVEEAKEHVTDESQLRWAELIWL